MAGIEQKQTPATTSRASRIVTSPEREQRGYVIILPGIEGYSFLNRRIRNGLLRAGVPYSIEIYDWTLRWPLALYNLRSRRLHESQVRILHEKILTYQQRFPNRPVFLIGHSGGGAMTLRVLESLPDKRTIAGAVLLGAAISPKYDCRPALQHVDRKIWNITSYADFLFLGMLTGIAGTLDGYHSLCAGMVGFGPQELSPIEAAKFQELPYRWEYFWTGNLAGHFGYTAPRFVERYVAPLLLQEDERCYESRIVEVTGTDRLPHPVTP